MADFKYDNKILCNLYFSQVEGDLNINLYKCKCGNKRVKTGGWSNLLTHVTQSHKEEYKSVYLAALSGDGGAIEQFVSQCSSKSKNIYGWMEQIVMNDLPQTFVENVFVKRYSRLLPISRNTVNKYLVRCQSIVKVIIKKMLPETFGLIFDGWTCTGEHYIAIFATWTAEKGSVMKRLLSCGVQDVPEDLDAAKVYGFTAADIGDYILDVLTFYDRSYDAIEFVCGDNCSVNSSLCNLMEIWIENNLGVSRKVNKTYVVS